MVLVQQAAGWTERRGPDAGERELTRGAMLGGKHRGKLAVQESTQQTPDLREPKEEHRAR